MVAGLRLSGLVAQKAYDQPMNAAMFEELLEKCLVPTLSKGDIVVMDNLSSHKGPRVEKLITDAGAQLRYLPPYSPDMNPIEKAYSKLKADLTQNRRAHRRGPDERSRRLRRDLQTRRMRKLLQGLRI